METRKTTQQPAPRDPDPDLDPDPPHPNAYDYLFKVILLGPSGAGKSSLLKRFVADSFNPVLTSQTIGVEFASKIVVSARRKRIKLQLWDTAGTERFRAVSRSYYRAAAGALLVYDLKDAETDHDLDGLKTFLADARALAPRVTVFLVGNKADRNERVSDTTSEWAADNGILLCESASALTGERVAEVFERLAASVLAKIELGLVDPDDPLSGVQYGDYFGHGGRAGIGGEGSRDGSVSSRGLVRGGMHVEDGPLAGRSGTDNVLRGLSDMVLPRRGGRRNCC